MKALTLVHKASAIIFSGELDHVKMPRIILEHRHERIVPGSELLAHNTLLPLATILRGKLIAFIANLSLALTFQRLTGAASMLRTTQAESLSSTTVTGACLIRR